jgi:hypothetical protein
MKRKILFTLLITTAVIKASAQEDSMRIFVTTGLSLTKVTGHLNSVLYPSIDFSSGIEAVLHNGWFAQGTLDISRLKYHQQVRDKQSSYLFQNTTADLLLMGLNGGKHFALTKALSASGYLGAGYITISEPRITLDGNIATQDDVHSSSIFGRTGTKLSLLTGIKFLPMIYLDASWWTTPLTIQSYPLHGLSIVVGAKMQM